MKIKNVFFSAKVDSIFCLFRHILPTPPLESEKCLRTCFWKEGKFHLCLIPPAAILPSLLLLFTEGERDREGHRAIEREDFSVYSSDGMIYTWRILFIHHRDSHWVSISLSLSQLSRTLKWKLRGWEFDKHKKMQTGQVFVHTVLLCSACNSRFMCLYFFLCPCLCV